MVTSHISCAQIRLELGVYLLGAIEPAQRAVVDRHLAACRSCRAELSSLAGLPSLLRRVPADVVQRLLADDTMQAMPEPPLNGLLSQVTAIRRRSRLLAAAAAVAAAIAAASAVQVLHDVTARPPAAVAPARAVTAEATNPVTGIWAAVRYTARPWGTELEVSIAGVAPGTHCQLLVTGQRGQVISAGGWDFAAGRQQWYPASVPIQPASLQRFAIVADGKTLVTIQPGKRMDGNVTGRADAHLDRSDGAALTLRQGSGLLPATERGAGPRGQSAGIAVRTLSAMGEPLPVSARSTV